MTESLISILVVAATAVLVIVVLVITGNKKRQTEAAIRQLALSSGWRYEQVKRANESGFILTGRDWELTSVMNSSNGSSEAGSSTLSFMNKWSTIRVTSPDGLVLIGPKTPSIPLTGLGTLGNFVMQQALRLMLGDEAMEADGLSEVFVGRNAYRDQYSVWATSQAAAEKVLTFELENALLKWNLKEKPLLKFSSRGVEIMTRQDRLNTPEEVLAMVDVGRAVLGG